MIRQLLLICSSLVLAICSDQSIADTKAYNFPKELQFVTDAIKGEIFDELSSDPSDWICGDNSAVFGGWLGSGKYYVIRNREHILGLFVDKNKQVILSKEKDYTTTKQLLSNHLKEFSVNKKEQLDFLSAMASLITYPPLLIGGESLYFNESDEKLKTDWLGGSEKDINVFKKYSLSAPKIDISNLTNQWGVSYYIFNLNGEVNQVEAKGNIHPFLVNEIMVKKVEKEGTFSWTLIGS